MLVKRVPETKQGDLMMCSTRDTPYFLDRGTATRWTKEMDQSRVVVAKHRLLVEQVYVCDVHSWNDSSDVQHGVSGKLEVTSRRFTPARTITDLPRFRLTLSSKGDASGLLGPFLDRLRSTRQVCKVIFGSMLYRCLSHRHEANHLLSFTHITHKVRVALLPETQAAVVVLNKRGWVGYLLPHETESKLYCHFHRQEHMDGELQVVGGVLSTHRFVYHALRSNIS